MIDFSSKRPAAKRPSRQGKKPSMMNDLRFLAIVAGATCILIVLGVYFIHQMFAGERMPGKIDLKNVITDLTVYRQDDLLAPNRINLFFTTDGKTLTPQVEEIDTSLGAYERARLVIESLLKGPTIGMFEPVIPEGVSLRGLYLKDDLAVIDLSKQFTESFDLGIIPQMLCVYSIVDSLILNVEPVKRVQILIEGEHGASLNGGIDIERPLFENVALIKR